MARGRAGEQRSNSVDGLTAAANHAAHVALPKLKFENGCSAARNFREHHVVGIFDQLPKDELEKFSHDGKIATNPPSHNATARQVNTNRHEFVPESKTQAFDSLLRQSSEGCGGGTNVSTPSAVTERRSTQRLFRLSTSGLRRFASCRFCDGWLRRRRHCFRGRRCYRRFRRSFRGGAGDLFFISLNQAAHGVGRLRALTDPIFGAIEFQRAVVTGLFRIVGANYLNEFSVARAAAIGHHHFVIRAILRSFSA